MQQTLLIKPQPILSTLPFPIHLTPIQHTTLSNNLSYPSLQSSSRRQTIVFARKNRRRWKISQKTALDCALFLATNLKLLPEPVNLILKEGLGDGGNGSRGGGVGFWNGFGGGEFDGWIPRRKKLGFLVLVGIACGVFLVVMLGKEFKGWSDLGLGVMGLLGLVVLEREWKRGVRGWILGFCSCALMVFLGFGREGDGRRGNSKGYSDRLRSAVLDFMRKSKRIRVL